MNLRLFSFLVSILVLASFASLVSPAEWYVDASVDESGDGSTWETAFKTIQEGIDAALDGDAVTVAPGTYTENIQFNGKNIALQSTDPLDPDVVQGTVIDGDGQGSVVTFAGNEDESCLLSGFTIRNGFSGSGAGVSGGDWANQALARIENNVISANLSSGNGGGIAFCYGTIRSNTITGNRALARGGGLAYCGGNIQGNTITGNYALQWGGGLSDCDGIIKNNIIAANSAEWSGGGLVLCDGSIENNTITGNSSYEGGGLNGCTAAITNSIIWGNFAPRSTDLLGSSTPTYSCVGEAEASGEGNISACPYFADPSTGDYHLLSWSPCIDAGDPLSDSSNEPVASAGRIDMGAYGNTPQAASPSADSDEDLLPDDWETFFFGGLGQTASADPDADTRSNLQELQDGTDPSWSGIWYVNILAPNPGDGKSLETAFQSVQEGIDAAWHGETVLVSPGIYVGNIFFKSKNITVRSTDPLNSSIVQQTIIDGGQKGSVVTFVGSETADCVLSGFTIRNGSAAMDPGNNRGGGIRGGYESYRTKAVIENNVITNCFAWDGGGLVYCGGTVRNNKITNNTAQDDGGALHRCSGIIEFNVILGNSAGDHGGAIAKSTSTIRHNVIAENSAGDQGGALRDCDGLIESNTFAGNVGSYGDTMALCDGAIRNCILWGDESRHGVQLYRCSVPTYSCIDRWKEGGLGNISSPPYFSYPPGHNYHLQPWSPCIDAGDPRSPFSQEPDPNGGRINLGAYGNTPQTTSRSLDTDDDKLPDGWELDVFGDLDQAGEDDADFDSVSNEQEYLRGTDPNVAPTSWYASAAAATSGDGTSQATPFKTIQEAIDAASAGDTVIVAPGLYFENIHFGGKNIVLRSIDPLNQSLVLSTIIDGQQLDSVVTFLGSEDESCALSGFTIRSGSGAYGGGICGGLEEAGTHATISNNHIVGNLAPGLYDESQHRWIGGYGGGLAFCDGLVRDNLISLNSAAFYGGGLYGCNATIRNNTVIGNVADSGSGGAMYDCDGIILNNLVLDNRASDSGGGLRGCDGTLQNNTIVNNRARRGGSGVDNCRGIIRNCIIWGNTSSSEQVVESAMPSFSCIEDWTEGGEGNLAGDPLFVNPSFADYHLGPSSPCASTGADYYWFVWPQTDLDGNSRRAGNRTDMGCYEYNASPDTDGDLLSDEQEIARQTDPFNPDTDGDGLRDGLEILRETDPLVQTSPDPTYISGYSSDIQKALCLALPGDEIVVYPGEYTGNLQVCGIDVTLRSLDAEDPDIVSTTVLDGDAAGPVVSFAGSEGSDCLLTGFTIRRGSADHGAGIRGGDRGRHTRAAIRNNVITSNDASGNGAGIAWCDGIIEGNSILQNEGYGSAVSHCHGVIRSNNISGNSRSGLGECDGDILNNIIVGNGSAGIYWCNGTIQGNTVSANQFDGMSGCCARILGNRITGNRGGLENCDGEIINNLIVGNRTTRGAGLYFCDGTVQNNTIAMNVARYDGGAMHSCDAAISNSIVWGNTGSAGPQMYLSGQPAYSCIQDNTGGVGNTARDPLFALVSPQNSGPWTETPVVDYQTYQSTLGDANASWEPGSLVGFTLVPDAGAWYHFVVASNTETTITIFGDVNQYFPFLQGSYYRLYDFHLSAGSPCIDTGRNEAWMWQSGDLDGNNRIFPGAFAWNVDMGCFECDVPARRASVTMVSGGALVAWVSLPEAAYAVYSCTDLAAGAWVEEAIVPSQGQTTSWQDSEATSTMKFYRVEYR